MLIDLLFAVGTLGFLMSDIKQLHKLHISDHSTDAISKGHLKIKLFSIVCVFVGYILSQLFISAGVASAQFILTIGILYYTYRGMKNEK